MEYENLEQVKELINRIADIYDIPTKEQVRKMQELTGVEWDAKDLQMACCEYWSHNSLEETAYFMFHEDYPPVQEEDLVFWKYKQGVVLDSQEVYEKYRLGKGKLKALEALLVKEIFQKVKEKFSDWKQDMETSNEESCRFICPEQKEYWTDTHFWIFLYGREANGQKETQMVRFSCHNMNEQQIQVIFACMEEFECSLYIREEKTMEYD
ncbi:MAG: hypothetical protein HFH63_13185 [Lachnospiraceae bacterium]|nr:hypothetical protein [Lachnospiraceae bacterium]